MHNRRRERATDDGTDETDPAGIPTGDPRLDRDRTRTIAGADGDVTLVGVVHEHPASVHRASAVVRRREPAVLALELPPMAIPLFTEYARDDRAPPAFGGEMSAAIQAAGTDRVVGIDGPSLPFLGKLATTVLRERPGREAIRGVFGGLTAATREAVACRVAGTVAAHTSIDLAVGSPVAHDCSRHDHPDRQAADEDGQIRRARAVMDAIEPSRAAQFRDAIREAHMADRLRSLAGDGDVVAVVGYGHLDPLVARLEDEPTDCT